MCLSGELSVGLSECLSVELSVGVAGGEWFVGVDLEVSWATSAVSIDESGKKGRSSCGVRWALEARGGVGAAPPPCEVLVVSSESRDVDGGGGPSVGVRLDPKYCGMTELEGKLRGGGVIRTRR